MCIAHTALHIAEGGLVDKLDAKRMHGQEVKGQIEYKAAVKERQEAASKQ